jgi:two-component system, NarL family, sensor histidine kinase UhpB
MKIERALRNLTSQKYAGTLTVNAGVALTSVPSSSAPAGAMQIANRTHLAAEVGVLLAVLLFAVWASARIAIRKIMLPMAEIAATAKRLAAGDLKARVTPSGPDEVVEVAVQFNRMLDIRDKMERALRISEQRFHSLADASPVGIFRTNRHGEPVYANQRWYEIVGTTPEQARDGGWVNAIHDDDRERVLRQWAESSSNALPFRSEYRFCDGYGIATWVRAEAVVQWCDDGVAAGHIGTVTDITESKIATEMSKTESARFQAFSARLLEMQESERRHIAYELHDEIGQALTAIKLSLRSLDAHVAVASRSRLDHAVLITEGTLAMVRGMTLDLRPPQLDHLGLVPALAWHIENRAELSGLSAHFAADKQIGRLRANIETVCYRIVQEAMTNVARHASAQNVWVDLQLAGGELHLTIRDDGVGFDIPQGQQRAKHGGSLGLLGMEERATHIGGHLEITSSRSGGTLVRAIFNAEPAAARVRAEQREAV